MKLTGAQALIKSLELENVEVVFGLPGGCILPAYDPILDSPIRHILVRHEQGAGHMAEGYAHVTGRPGVAMVTSGPAATNLVTPLCDAYMDSVPMVAITGQVSRPVIGTDGFQECDTVGITRSVTKHNELIMDPDEIPLLVRQAFHLATTGRPGPVLLDVPKDVLQAEMTWSWPTDADVAASLPGYKPTVNGHPRMIKEAARLIAEARRPVIYAGGGILKSRAAEALRQLAELIDVPVVTTLMARGAFPDDHPLCLGHAGHARQLHRHHRHAAGGPADRPGHPLRRPGDRAGRQLRPRSQGHPRRHRPGRAGQDPPARRADRRRLPPGHHRAGPGPAAPRAARPAGVAEPPLGLAGALPAPLRPARRGRRPQAAVRDGGAARLRPRGHHPGVGGRPASDVGQPVLALHRALHLGELRRARAPWASACRRPSGPRWAARTAPCGRWTATAASR